MKRPKSSISQIGIYKTKQWEYLDQDPCSTHSYYAFHLSYQGQQNIELLENSTFCVCFLRVPLAAFSKAQGSISCPLYQWSWKRISQKHYNFWLVLGHIFPTNAEKSVRILAQASTSTRWLLRKMHAIAVNLPFLIPVGCFDIGLARCFLEAGPKEKAITNSIERFFW